MHFYFSQTRIYKVNVMSDPQIPYKYVILIKLFILRYEICLLQGGITNDIFLST